MSAIEVLPVLRCRRCAEDRPHRLIALRLHLLACCSCGTWRRP